MEPKTTILCISDDGMEKGNVSCDTNEILEPFDKNQSFSFTLCTFVCKTFDFAREF